MMDPIQLNYVNNYLRPGPSTGTSYRSVGPSGGGTYYDPISADEGPNTLPEGPDYIRLRREDSTNYAFHVGGPQNRIFFDGNVLVGVPQAKDDNWMLVRWPRIFSDAEREAVKLAEPFPVPDVKTQSAEQAYRLILENVGATLPKRDAVDKRMMRNIKNGGGHILDSQYEVGGWPEYSCRQAHLDSDRDGMPDKWERAHELAPMDAGDTHGDQDGDGYTNVEEYLNDSDPNRSDLATR